MIHRDLAVDAFRLKVFPGLRYRPGIHGQSLDQEFPALLQFLRQLPVRYAQLHAQSGANAGRLEYVVRRLLAGYGR